jgi:hypothetical protein
MINTIRQIEFLNVAVFNLTDILSEHTLVDLSSGICPHIGLVRDNTPLARDFPTYDNPRWAIELLQVRNFINDIIRDWDKFSGDITFPVPSNATDFPCFPDDHAMAFYSTAGNDMLSNARQYGKDRKSLCAHILVTLEREIHLAQNRLAHS